MKLRWPKNKGTFSYYLAFLGASSTANQAQSINKQTNRALIPIIIIASVCGIFLWLFFVVVCFIDYVRRILGKL